jgi:hypothetical protein
MFDQRLILTSLSFYQQGLLYHWTKYVQKSVSLIIPGRVENWGTSSCTPMTGLCKEETFYNILEPHSCRHRAKREKSPYRDFFHFTGDRKPWWSNQTLLEQDLREHSVTAKETGDVPGGKFQIPSNLNFRQEWYWHLKVALSSVDMVDKVMSLGFMGREDTPVLGRSSSVQQMDRYVASKQRYSKTLQI